MPAFKKNDKFGTSRVGDLVWMPLSSLTVPPKGDPLYDPHGEIPPTEDEIAMTVEKGIMQPAEIGKRGDKVMIRKGRRRYAMLEAANKRLVSDGVAPHDMPCTYRRISDEEGALEVAIENEHRAANTDLMRANSIANLANMGHDEERIARAFNISVREVKNYLKVPELPKAARDALSDGSMTLTAALQFDGTTPAEAAEKIEAVKKETKPGKKVTVDKAKKAAGKPVRKIQGIKAIRTAMSTESAREMLRGKAQEMIDSGRDPVSVAEQFFFTGMCDAIGYKDEQVWKDYHSTRPDYDPDQDCTD